MADRLNVQGDGLANVVRLIHDDGSHDLDPDHALELGESLIRQAREVKTEQTRITSEPSDRSQPTLAEASETDTESLAEMRERVVSEDREPVEIGDFLNDADPMEW